MQDPDFSSLQRDADASRDTIPLTPALSPGVPGERGEDGPALSSKVALDRQFKLLDYLGPTPSFPLAFAGLLHQVPASTADAICLRLRLSNSERLQTGWLIENREALCGVKTMRTCQVKRLLAHPGIHELLALHRADALAGERDVAHVEYCEKLLREWPPEELDPEPLLTGDHLIRLGLKPGPHFKSILDSVRDAQLDGTVRTIEEAAELAMRLRSEPDA